MSVSELSQQLSEQADEVLNEVLPDAFDWQRMVRSYPLPALTLAALGGAWVGRRHGTAVLSGVLDFGTAEASRIAGDLFGQVLGSNPLAPDSYEDGNSYGDGNSYEDGDSFEDGESFQADE